MPDALFILIALGIPVMVWLIIRAGEAHARRGCQVKDCVICRVTRKGGDRRG